MLNFLKRPLNTFFSWLAQVTAVDVGKPDDGLVPMSAGTDVDKDWRTLLQEFSDALDAWRKNPIARRIVNIVTAYVVGGDGIRLKAPDYETFDRFLQQFINHPKNHLMLRQSDWCDELTRSGEIFPVLFTNPVDGMSYVRMVPASKIKDIDWKEGDYETELRYYEDTGSLEDDKIWYSPHAPEARPKDNGDPPPVMLHYAINRPVGAIRGESDLAPILPWLKRYSRWLEDRVRLNAAIRAFLWIVKVPSNMVKEKEEQYRKPPSPGSVIIADKESEEWEAVTPSIKAADASHDGRAIRWMVVAGGPGIGLHDIGEAATSNLATAKAMSEQRRRFLRRRQAYFSFILADLAVQAWNRAVALDLQRGRIVTPEIVEVQTPDVAPEDNVTLAEAAREMAGAMKDLRETLGPSEQFRRLVLKMVLKFAGETITEEQFEGIVSEEPPAHDDDQGDDSGLISIPA